MQFLHWTVMRLGRPVGLSASEMVEVLIMSIALAHYQRIEIEQGHSELGQVIMPRDLLRSIKFTKPLALAV